MRYEFKRLVKPVAPDYGVVDRASRIVEQER